MKAITVCQPFAQLIVIGVKKIETRAWTTGYRGRLAIHSANNVWKPYREIANANDIACTLEQAGFHSWAELPRGYVVGEVDLHAIIPAEHADPDELQRRLGHFSFERYAWMLADPLCYERPIRARGAPGLWAFDPTRAFKHVSC